MSNEGAVDVIDGVAEGDWSITVVQIGNRRRTIDKTGGSKYAIIVRRVLIADLALKSVGRSVQNGVRVRLSDEEKEDEENHLIYEG